MYVSNIIITISDTDCSEHDVKEADAESIPVTKEDISLNEPKSKSTLLTLLQNSRRHPGHNKHRKHMNTS